MNLKSLLVTAALIGCGQKFPTDLNADSERTFHGRISPCEQKEDEKYTIERELELSARKLTDVYRQITQKNLGILIESDLQNINALRLTQGLGTISIAPIRTPNPQLSTRHRTTHNRLSQYDEIIQSWHTEVSNQKRLLNERQEILTILTECN